MIFVASTGLQLSLGRIDRRVIDNYQASNPPPEPPIRTVEVFGGETEQLPILDDPQYQRKLLEYQRIIGTQRLDLIANAITFDSDVNVQGSKELRSLGVDLSPANILRFSGKLTTADLIAVVEEILYQSTVTQRGIDEAEARFAVTYMERPVMAWKVGGSAALQSGYYEQWVVAHALGYTWESFCDLPGPMQSECVAFKRIQDRLHWLMSKY